eukprot:m.415364 g.415364  ORF g.415364 m.415364 type:complete len:487 (-) comp29598_c0_seq1:309-1769(-)
MSRVSSLLRWGQQKAPPRGADADPEPDPDPPEIMGRQTFNPIGQMYLLSAHTDIVRHLCKLSTTRFASASDDHSVMIWDTDTHQCIGQLRGHTMPVTCMLVVRHPDHDDNVLLTGSTDKCIRVWDLESTECVATWESQSGTVKSLADLRGGLCCSGGHNLCVWSISDGRLASRVKIDEAFDTDIRETIAVDNGNLIVAACDDKQLLAYRVKRGVASGGAELIPIKKLLGHREPIQCLHKLTEHAFVSGSLDGSVCLWDVSTLDLIRVLNFHEVYVLRDKSMHTYLYSVHHLTSVGDWIVAASGSGFVVFSRATGKLVGKQRAAHSAPVSKILLFGGADEMCVVTASIDATVKVWDVSSCCIAADAAEVVQASPILELARKMTPISPSKSRARRAEPRLIGHLHGHTGAVNDLMESDGLGFVTCASDRTVISWRNSIVEWQRLNEATLDAVTHFCPEVRAQTPTLQDAHLEENDSELQTPTKWQADV